MHITRTLDGPTERIGGEIITTDSGIDGVEENSYATHAKDQAI